MQLCYFKNAYNERKRRYSDITKEFEENIGFISEDLTFVGLSNACCCPVPRKYSSERNFNNNMSARDRFAYFFGI